MYNPATTYRIQFNKDFTFSHLEGIIPYLKKLGIGAIYASPIFEAVPGSTHGYDVTNPHVINPEIGTEEQLRSLTKLLRSAGIGWIQDIVPNHMAFHPQNQWLMDVLEKGVKSEFYSFFDILWNSNAYSGKVMVPFLGEPLGKSVDSGAIKVDFDNHKLVLKYYESAYPLHLRSYQRILGAIEAPKPDNVISLLAQIDNILHAENPKIYSLMMGELQLELCPLMQQNEFYSHVHACLDQVNQETGFIREVIEDQVYQLCHWQETDTSINYRRFFTVNGLICLNMQEESVFSIYHQKIKAFVDEGVFNGLRVDHVDGLFDPTTYLERLRKLVGEDIYIVVEKILMTDEELPPNWPIQGETGYGFLGIINNLFTNMENEPKFTDFYKELVKDETSIHGQIHEKKVYILFEHMRGELDNLYQLFMESNLVDREVLESIDREKLKETIGEFLVLCPVYRYYGRSFPLPESEKAAIGSILKQIRDKKKQLAASTKIMEHVLLSNSKKGDIAYNKKALHWYQRLMQFTGPLMAKGVEDTLMYTYNRFVGHNEVGDAPENFGLSAGEFHQKMIYRRTQYPLALNSTATHDTKRGEDVRMRLNALTDVADEWINIVRKWKKENESLKQEDALSVNDEYLIYQTLLGAHPMPEAANDDFTNRVQQYLEKALREGKVNSNWSEPDVDYEEAAKKFSAALLSNKNGFSASFETFLKEVSDYGIVNSLAQVLLKFTCPGIPDVYQGTEFWDLSLVDPDNRRPVAFGDRMEWLDKLENIDVTSALWDNAWKNRNNGQIKLSLIRFLLQERKHAADLFLKGEYVPLQAQGEYKKHVMAFARKHRHIWYITAVPLNIALVCKGQGCTIDSIDWKDTVVLLPDDAPQEWSSILLGEQVTVEGALSVNKLWEGLPIALLKGRQQKVRGSGVLLHITSLASPFGIGDLGMESRSFADFLQRCHQKYWQILPLNPIEKSQFYSPYSATSSMAGNILLISPELLADEGLLTHEELKQYHLPQCGVTLYDEVERVKGKLFDKAWVNFKQGNHEALHIDFEEFKRVDWLQDYALYSTLKSIHNGNPWYRWPDLYKNRNKAALEKFITDNEDHIEQQKWLQFIFFRQWARLRKYCQNKGIKFLGDMPFYVSYDAVDVWANKEIFRLDDKGNMLGIAGVPPDYFNEDGQLWGMPVFNWETAKEQTYTWWLERIRASISLCDEIRLDHFRAFSSYWEVPAGEATAKNGEWKKGPGEDFFKFLKQELGSLPFIAEDLGVIDIAVEDLRDQFHLPGMKILQFAFGDNLPDSPYIPHNYTHNYIVYTGTHDNNTTRGWYREEGSQYHQQIEEYAGRPFQEDDIAKIMAHMAMASVANTAILPLQDILGLDEVARMNTPGAIEDNWLWRLLPGQIHAEAGKWLKTSTILFNRD